MQKKYSYLMLALLWSMLWLPLQLMAQDDPNTVLQPQFGKQTVTVATGQEITYYDWKGTGSISASSSSNSQSLTVFKPAEAGMSVQITFESFDVRNDGSSWFGQAKIYNGEVDDSNFTWATTTGDVTASSTLPAGNVIETLDGTYTNKVYYSTASDGALSVGFLYRYAKACNGWVAKVKCVKLEDMSVTDAGSQYNNVIATPQSRSYVNLAGLFVNTTGMMNADHLKTVSFRLTENENAVDPLSLKLFKGSDVSYKGATPLDATVTENGGIYTFTLDKALDNGKNEFTIVGDFKGEAAVGAKVKLDVTGVTTATKPEGVTPFASADAVEIENPAIVFFPAEYQTITVTDTPVSFYDDGGPTEKVSLGFNSMVTFKPASADKKVMINFSKMNLFESSLHDDAKSQYILIYNGSTDDEANLIRTVRETETPFVRSNSEDGALTIKFVSGSELSYTRDGFEAEVSLFTPQPMTTQSIETTQASVKTLAAGDTDQEILKLNVKTENNFPALTAKKFSFTTNGTNDIISKAAVYYTKSAANFATSVKVGEAQVTGDAVEITATNEVSLVEGDNYFWLAYDIKESAANGQKVDAAVASVTLSDATHTVAEGNPEGNREVLNQVESHLDQGTVTKRVNGSMLFKTKNKKEYSSDYESGKDDRINIFEPYNAGMICQIEFSKFALFYASSTYNPDHASMKIYSGKGTTGELLWESSRETKDVGPGKLLRSTSADGALTVVFNAGVSDSWNTANGFQATVSEYLSKPMAVSATTVEQSAKEIAGVGEKDLDLLSVNVFTEGNEDAKSLSAITLNLKNSAAAVSKINLYALDKQGDTVDADALPVATADINPEATTATLSLTTPKSLVEGNNWYLIRCDISDIATSGNIVDAAVTSLTVGEETVAVENGDPEGAITVMNLVNMKQGDNGEILIKEGAPLMFYDDGGVDGNYSENFSGTVTFAPKTPGQSVKLTFKEWAVTARDNIYIYNGGEVKEQADATYSMYDKPTYFLSDAADGKVTVKFVTKYSKAGFAIEVTAYEKQPIHIASVEATPTAPATTLKGAETQLMKVAVVADDDLNTLNIQKFTVGEYDTNAISSVNVYATGTSDVFAPVNLYGQATAGKTDINGEYKITKPGTYYFWLTANVATTAAEKAAVSASLTSVTGNEVVTTLTEPVAATTTVTAGKSGTYTVGAGADFGTIQGAVNSLKDGIDGPVVINIKRGIYNENVEIPEIPGASATNTITIQSESGDYHDVQIYHNTYNEPTYSDDKMFAEYGVFTVAGADWVTLRGLELTTTDTTYPGVLHVKNASRHLTVDGCYIHAKMETNYSNDINLVYTYVRSKFENQNNDYLTVKNCLLEGGYIGVRMGGTSTVVQTKEVGGIIENNIIRDFGAKGIYLHDELGAKVRNNRIENTKTTKSVEAMDIDSKYAGDDNVEISGNKINLSVSNTAAGISMRSVIGTDNAPVNVFNNEVVISSDNASSVGIKIGSASKNMNIAYNTVNMNGNAKSSALWFNDTGIENMNVLNNIFMNKAGGYAYRYYKAECVGKATYAHNVAHTSGSVFAYDKSELATYEDWKAKSNETDGQNELVEFLDEENELQPTAEGYLLTAQPLAYVTTDITGTERNATTPTIGAYEFDACTKAAEMAEGYPTVGNIKDTSADVKVIFNQSGVAQFIAKEATATAPTAEELTTSENALNVHKNEVATATVEGLEKDKEYIIYTALTNINGTTSLVYATSKFVAGGEVIKEIPNTDVVAEATESVAAGLKAQLKATVSKGTAPFSISWTNGKRNEIATATLEDYGTAISEYAPTECDLYYVTVTDANGKQASDTCRVIVTGEAVTATFENLYLDNESFWAGPDTKGTVMEGAYGDEMAGSFVSGSYQFSNSYNVEYGSWSGFAYSNRTATDFNSITPDQYNNVVGNGYDSSENFAVAFNSGEIKVLNSPLTGDSIRGLYVTSNAYAVNTILYAKDNDYAHKFAKGDWLKITFTGNHADGSKATMDYYLADYRADKEADHYCLDSWQWVDLRSLGEVTSIKFSLSGSDSGQYGLNTPVYFCIDNFNGNRIVADAELQTKAGEFDLSKMFTFDDAEATVAYAFADAVGEDIAKYVTIENGMLKVSNQLTKKFNVVVSATQKGKVQFLNIPFDVVKYIPEVKATASATASVGEGQKAELKANVTDGTAPFSISWLNGKREQIATASLETLGEATSEYAPSECDLYYLLVTDANGKVASDTCRVIVTGEAVTATFENLYLDTDSYWAGPDTKGTVGEAWGATQYNGSFVSGSYEFQNSYIPAWSSWTGFAYSNRTATSFETMTTDQYNSAVGNGYDNSENFAVAFDNGVINVKNNSVAGDCIRGFYITNNAWVTESVKNGNGTARKFEKGDYLKVILTGTKVDGTTAEVEYYLADYRSAKEADHYCLDSWQWVDLRSLGNVKSISFRLDGTDKGQYGLNTPAYFCLDNFNGNRVVGEANTQTAGGEIDLSKFFNFDDAEATVSYAFADALDEETAQNVTLTSDGRLTIKKGFEKKFDITVSATQKGKIQFLKIPFDIPTGINKVYGEDDANVSARYNISGQKLNNRQRGINIIRTKDGKTVKVGVK